MSDTRDIIRASIESWGKLWGLPKLSADVTVSFSTRMTASLGRCRPETGRVTLNAALLDSAQDLMIEVLCHEVAHVAARRVALKKPRPHGVEWQDLVRQAGHVPRIRTQSRRLRKVRSPRRYFYEHRCPVCHAVRFARRAVKTWICAACDDNRLS